jgi:polyhydroxyalkanoate synthase
MSAAPHAAFVDGALDNSIARPALAVRACPSTCRGSSSTPAWAARIADHVTLWDACYRSIQLLGGMSRFVLSTSTHIAALVNPLGQPAGT